MIDTLLLRFSGRSKRVVAAVVVSLYWIMTPFIYVSVWFLRRLFSGPFEVNLQGFEGLVLILASISLVAVLVVWMVWLPSMILGMIRLMRPSVNGEAE